jgi:mono/diheme cytochrome c family protein
MSRRWHHPTEALLRIIEHGGAPLGGVMPAFGSVTEEQQTLDIIAYFQSWWTDDVYTRWFKFENR